MAEPRIAEEDSEGFEATPSERHALLESIAEADRGSVVDGWKLLDSLSTR